MSVTFSPNPALYLSPEMVTELALGQDNPLDIAGKYGLTAHEFGQLQAQEWFGAAIYRKREELQAHGITFTAKAMMMAEEMWTDIYQASKVSDMRMEHRIAAAKELTDISGMKPKAAAGVPGSGPSFTIQINLPSDPQGPTTHQLHTEKAKVEPALTIEMDGMALPPKPIGMKVPDFKLKDDLVGAPVAAHLMPATSPVRWP